jgi:glyoxylase-like metal-dependent hydrolase (beta-lactamase superfamily II)
MVEQLHYDKVLDISILRVLSDIFNSNIYIIYIKKEGQITVIDPSEENNNNLIDWLKIGKKKVSHCLITHEHFDHHAGLKKLIEYNGRLNVICSSETRLSLVDAKKNLSFYSNKNLVLEDFENLIFSQDVKAIETIKTPGHSKGSYCFLFKNFLFSGDTVIDNEYLVTKLPGGNKNELKASFCFLKKHLKKQNEIIVFPGHGKPFDLKNWINENT